MDSTLTTFSYNYSAWPIVDIEGPPYVEDIISDQLEHEITVWNEYFNHHFTYNYGFDDPSAQKWVNEEYQRLCQRLREEGVSFREDNWWNNDEFEVRPTPIDNPIKRLAKRLIGH